MSVSDYAMCVPKETPEVIVSLGAITFNFSLVNKRQFTLGSEIKDVI